MTKSPKYGSKGKFKFTVNESVLCYHGPLLYRAKCIGTEFREDKVTPKYKIHYLGWNKNWDEWVDETRVLKHNEEGQQRMKELVESLSSASASKKSSKRKSADRDGDKKSKSKKKHKTDDEVETEDEFLNKIEVELPIPDLLRRQLVEDWEGITIHKKLVSLPRNPTVNQILQDFRKSKIKTASFADGVVQEVIEGLKTYFDQALGVILLYKFERPAYMVALEENKKTSMSDIYGAEHLLRLFVKLPNLLAHTNMDQDSLTILTINLKEVLKYMEKNQSTFFLKQYDDTTPEYQKLAEEEVPPH